MGKLRSQRTMGKDDQDNAKVLDRHLLPLDVSRLLSSAWWVAIPGAAFLPLLDHDGIQTAMLIGMAV